MNIKKSLLLLLTLFFLTSCQDVIDLEVEGGEVQLVVDGWLTNQNGEKQAILSTTANYFNSSIGPFVENAFVVLNNEQGPIDTFYEKSNGLYVTDFVGEVGETYHIYIRTSSGEEYKSNPELLRSVPLITAINSEFKEETTFDDEGYYMSIDTDEPLGVGDHYRWKQYVNDTYLNEPFDLLYASDEFVDGNPILNFEVTINEPLELGDQYRIQQLSITEEAFEFITQLQTQTAFVGSLFDSPPAALSGNIVNLDSSGKKALGYFGASAVSEKEMVIE
ncbi:MAG: hypothetical protein ACI9VN_003903 [Patescibacteria group bacterium]|jgi:hypothetical protein